MLKVRVTSCGWLSNRSLNPHEQEKMCIREDTTTSIVRGDLKYVEEEEENNPCYRCHGGRGVHEEREGKSALLYNHFLIQLQA